MRKITKILRKMSCKIDNWPKLNFRNGLKGSPFGLKSQEHNGSRREIGTRGIFTPLPLSGKGKMP